MSSTPGPWDPKPDPDDGTADSAAPRSPASFDDPTAPRYGQDPFGTGAPTSAPTTAVPTQPTRPVPQPAVGQDPASGRQATQGQAPQYGQGPVYGQAPQYGQPPAYGQAPHYGQGPAYPPGQPSPTYGQTPGYSPPPYGTPYAQGPYQNYPGASSSGTPASTIVLVIISAITTFGCIGLPSLVLSIIAVSKSGSDPQLAKTLTKVGWGVFGGLIAVAVVYWIVMIATTMGRSR